MCYEIKSQLYSVKSWKVEFCNFFSGAIKEDMTKVSSRIKDVLPEKSDGRKNGI